MVSTITLSHCYCVGNSEYDAVVANPPYIGSKFHVPLLKKL